MLGAAAFAAGVIAASTIGPLVSGQARYAATSANATGGASGRGVIIPAGYPAELVRVIDGDTFEARVRVWPGMEITTRVRLRGIDAPELHARCPEERIKAEAARDALSALLAEGKIGIMHVGNDKYGGRVDADVSTRRTANVSEALFAAGHARHYGGGHRDGWCPARSS